MNLKIMCRNLLAMICVICLTAGVVGFIPAQAKAEEIHPTGYVRTTTLSLRASKSASADVVEKLSKYDNVTILDHTGSWYKVNASHKDIVYRGYVPAKYITLNTICNPLKSGYIQKSATLRKVPEADGKKVVYLSVNDKVTVKGLVGKWYKVRAKHKGSYYTGYVLRSLVKSTKAAVSEKPAENTTKPEESTPAASDTSYAVGHVNHDYLNLRSSRSTADTSNIVLKLSRDDKVVIIEDYGYWLKVEATHSGKVYKGFVASEYIKIDTPAKTGTSTTSNTSGNTNTTNTATTQGQPTSGSN